MSLFRPYQYKARPDLLDNAPVKKGFFRFFELYFRKFWRFLSLNLWYFFITLPMVIYVFYLVNGLFADRLSAAGDGTVLLAGVGFIAAFFDFVPKVLYKPLLILSVILYGPFTMGLTYIFRNYAREEHAWISDLWSRAWSNVRQGLVFGLLDLGLTWLFVNGMFGTIAEAGKNAGYAMSVILSVVCGIALVIWLFMRHYTYLMAVSVNLSVFHILKNAWLFVVLGFGRNCISFLVSLACVVVTFLLAPLITIVTLPFLFWSLTWFSTVFACYPIVKKYIIVPALEQAGEASEPDEQASEESKETADHNQEEDNQ